jgi:hypothetical protein
LAINPVNQFIFWETNGKYTSLQKDDDKAGKKPVERERKRWADELMPPRGETVMIKLPLNKPFSKYPKPMANTELGSPRQVQEISTDLGKTWTTLTNEEKNN